MPIRGLTLILLLLGASAAMAQNQVDRSFYYDFGEKVYYDVLNVAHPAQDSTRFLVLFRLRNDLLTFTTTEDRAEREARYLATPVTYVEFFDGQGVIRQSSEWHDTIYVKDYQKTVSKTEYILGAVECTVPTGTYTVAIEVGDERTPRQFSYKIEDVKGESFSGDHVGRPLFCFEGTSPSDVRPGVLKEQVQFNQDVRVLVPLAGYNASDEFNYSVRRVIKGNPEDTPQWFPGIVDITGVTRPKEMERLRIDGGRSGKELSLRYDRAADGLSLPSSQDEPRTGPQPGGNRLGVLDFVVPGATLEPGNYELELYVSGGSDTLSATFKVIWLNQPLSLRNLQYATELTYFLTTEEEYDDLRSGSKSERLKKFLDFWQRRDPTPGTAYNEAMAEYFARVDYAHFNYRTIKQRDGARTDRGKIFILHGAPTKTDRRLDPNAAPREVWTYDNNVAREFVFESESSGVFSLVEVKKLE